MCELDRVCPEDFRGGKTEIDYARKMGPTGASTVDLTRFLGARLSKRDTDGQD